MNYFIYNGIKSSDLGVYIQNKNTFSSPKYDASFVSIPGRNGDLISSMVGILIYPFPILVSLLQSP